MKLEEKKGKMASKMDKSEALKRKKEKLEYENIVGAGRKKDIIGYKRGNFMKVMRGDR